MKKNILNNKGVTLIELLIVLAIIGIILQVVYSIFFVGNKSFNIGKDRGFAQQDARIASDIVIKELRTAKSISFIDGEFTGKHYSLSRNSSGQLIRTSFDGINITETKVLFSGSLIGLKFNNKLNESNVIVSGIVNGKIIAEEGKQQTSFNFDILLENIPNYNTVITDEETIYYTKYD